MTLLFGLLLGAGFASYIILSSSALGFAFPSINGELSVRPTFSRILKFILGRWMAMSIIALVASGIGHFVDSGLVRQFLMVINAFLGIFIFIYVLTEESPELAVARQTDISKRQLPLFFLGMGSACLLIAPNIIAIIWAFSKLGLYESIIFFTNIFLGYSLIILPRLLNQNWIKQSIYHYFIKLLLLCCGSMVIFLSIKEMFIP